MRPDPLTRLGALVAACLPLLMGGGCEKKTAPGPTVAIGGHNWQVEQALTPEQRSEGLGHRHSLPKGRGMLFVFPDSKPREFWMKNCLFAIDIAFISAEGRVVSVQTMYPQPDALDNELKTYSSGGDAKFALEVSGGELVNAGIKPGDAVTLPANLPAARS